MTETMPGPAAIEGRDLRALRTAAGFSLRGLARHSGYSTSYLSRIETDARAATPALRRLYATLATARPDAGTGAGTRAASATPAHPSAPLDVGILWFGAEVRRRRMAQRMSLTALGAEVYLSRAQLGKVEQGAARASYQVALALDSVLGADGRLGGLFLEECARVGPVPADVSILTHPRPETPVGWSGATAFGFAAAASVDPAELAHLAARALEGLRIRSHRAGPFSILDDLSVGVVALHAQAAAHAPGAAEPLWSLALRYAELLGWCAQETGHDDIALRWTLKAADWARAIGDSEALGYALIRQSQWARRRGDTAAALRAAHEAGAMDTTQQIKRFAAQRAAQASALARDEPGFRRALDRYHDLAPGRDDQPADDPARPRWGPLPDPLFEQSRIFEATCLVDLGDFNAAATLFDQHMGRLRSGRTGYSRLAVREAIAYAHTGDPELACQVAAQALPVIARQGSASLRGDLAQLTRTLNRHRRNPAVRDLLPELTMLARAAGTVPVATGRQSAHLLIPSTLSTEPPKESA